MKRLIRIVLWGFVLLTAVSCRAEGGSLGVVTMVEATPTLVPIAMIPSAVTEAVSMETAVPTVVPTAVPTAALPATATAVATQTSVPTATPNPTNTPTDAPTPTPFSTYTPEPNRNCPNPAPLKPDYGRYFLSPQAWPVPNEANASSHFWLSKPLPGGGRLLINQTYPYGYDGNGRYLLHNGIDSAEALGTPLLAVADGTIIVAQADDHELFGWRCAWYGRLIILELDETWQGQQIYALYGHVLEISVEVGQRVQRGEQIAEVGFGGAASVPHLHFELRIGSNSFDETRNPMLWIDPGETRGVIAGRLVDPQGRPWQGVTLTLIGRGGNPDLTNTWSYLDDPRHMINPDEFLAENFVFADVPPGDYEIYTKLQGVEYRLPISVIGGALTRIELVTEPFKTPTPVPIEDN
jgi:murein DD-endopeptidase MepM/ murein hydrolase activator NlpD